MIRMLVVHSDLTVEVWNYQTWPGAIDRAKKLLEPKHRVIRFFISGEGLLEEFTVEQMRKA